MITHHCRASGVANQGTNGLEEEATWRRSPRDACNLLSSAASITTALKELKLP